MNRLSTLKAGDWVEIIAPASRCSSHQLSELKSLLESWQLNCLIQDSIFGDELLCAHTDEKRLEHLVNSLCNPDTQAVICARGGYGSMRLIPELAKITPPDRAKLFVGLSDITALHLFFQRHWHWPTLHATLSPGKVSKESLECSKRLLFGDVSEMRFNSLLPLNQIARQFTQINSSVLGGNLSLIQNSIGTLWELDAQDKIIVIEEVGERAYRVDRMLEHLHQSELLNRAKAVVFADFLECEEPDGSSLISEVLERFASRLAIPVLKMSGVGHGLVNEPVPFGTRATLIAGEAGQLIVEA